MRVQTRGELPETYRCRLCGAEKPILEMVLVRTQGLFLLRPRCKACNNTRERGHRRDYKRNYLRRWRKLNPEVNESYWREAAQRNRALTNTRAHDRFSRDHAAILIQGRLRRRLGMSISIEEARKLANKFGCCYPTRFGLTLGGLRECERIRSRMRICGLKPNPVEIRMMVYEDGHFQKPSRQRMPYQRSAEQLRNWHEQRRRVKA